MKTQKRLTTVAFLGKEGSYSHLAAGKFFPAKNQLIPMKSIESVVLSVTRKKALYGVIPIENSTTGSIFETYDLLIKHDLFIVGENYMCIHHQLLVKPGFPLSKVTQCISHVQAFDQCRNFLAQNPKIKLVYVADTATAAKQVSESDRPFAAIASLQAAKLYNLKAAATNIEDNKRNFTRFAVVAKSAVSQGNKMTVILLVKHVPGSLYRALAPIALSGFNLTKIESRPILGSLWEYLFIVDFELGGLSSRLSETLTQLRQNTERITILGRYEKGKSNET